MCGIAGFLINSSGDDNTFILKQMADTISHRGPDDEGFFESVTQDQEYHVGFAHRRLSIIDLASGHQPIGNEDGSIQIIFNGEIYNFQKLRNTLMNLGHQFVTNSDTESIVHAYEEYGDRFVEHLDGMFAIAIWDGRLDKLLLVRDRFGQKPLFLCEANGNLVFASEVKSILLCPWVKPSINKQAIYQYLSYRYVPGPYTLFSGIYKLPPGSIAMWENGTLTQQSYYSPPDRFAPSGKPVPFDSVNSFLKKLDQSVQMRMVSDVPFGAFLSGGIDSSAIVALMSHHSNLPIKTFSIGFEEKAYNELNHARTIAKRFNTDHHELIISQKHLMDELEKLTWFRDAPVTEPSDIPIFLLSKEARKSVKMVLTGEGSDEFLGGYPKHVFERYTRIYQTIPTIIRHNLIEPLVYALPFRFRRAKTAITNLGLENTYRRFPGWFGACSGDDRDNLTMITDSNGKTDKEVQFNTDPQNSWLRQILYFDQTSWLPDNLLERGDRMTMAASLEARMPFMDHRLAEFVSALPDHYRVTRHQTKWILRKAMEKKLPKKILQRPKIGFRVPVNQWFQGAMKEYLFDHLMSKKSLTKEYFRPTALNKLIDEHVRGRQNHEKLLWTLLTLEIWHRRFKIHP